MQLQPIHNEQVTKVVSNQSYLFDLGHYSVRARVHQLSLIPLLLPLLVARGRFVSSFRSPLVPPFLLLLFREKRSGEVWVAI